MAGAAGASEAKVSLEQGYKAAAYILIHIVNEARALENELVQVHGEEIRELRAEKEADLAHLEVDARKAEQVLQKAIDTSRNLMLNLLEFLRRLKNMELEQVKLDLRLRTKKVPKHLSEFLRQMDRQNLNAFERELKQVNDVTASLFTGLKDAESRV